MKLRIPQRFPGHTGPSFGRGHHRSLSRCFRLKSISPTTPSRGFRLDVRRLKEKPPYIGLEEVHDGVWNLIYYDTFLGRFDERTNAITGAPSTRRGC